MRKYLLLIVIWSALFGWPVLASEPNISGFIPGQIWYSKEPLVEGQTVNIHTAVWNGELNSITTKVEFYDKNVILGSREVLVASMELKDIYLPWKITSGDHLISAKIISSTVIIAGKKEKVSLNRTTTANDKQFVSVVIKNQLGESVSSTDLLKNQVDKTTAEISNIIPENISNNVSTSLTGVNNFRTSTLQTVEGLKDTAQKEINLAQKKEVKVSGNQTIEEAIQTPLAYIKLFLFTVLTFILGSKIIFYGLIILIIFLILRLIYRLIQNR